MNPAITVIYHIMDLIPGGPIHEANIQNSLYPKFLVKQSYKVFEKNIHW